ncbi:MAG: DUF2797 domain-containing protein [Lentisphaeraceae bacterium]|nr:DUF2797 domain-containing protein [Lentisphaeraceae bacterium]
MNFCGTLRKMKNNYCQDTGNVSYQLNLDNEAVCDLNNYIGKEVSISFEGKIFCTNCNKKIRKAYSDGLCYPCMTKLPQADMCILKPEKCHHHLGTCRDPQWGLDNCFQPHTLYLARSSSIKVGITRGEVPFGRWMDQGAIEGMAIGIFPSRIEVGKAEYTISEQVSDRTNWRKMLTNDVTDVPFDEYIDMAKGLLDENQRQHLIENPKSYKLTYPVQEFPTKVKSCNLTKMPYISKTLTGIKGQYLIFDNEVLNLRSHAGFEINFSTDNA